MYTVYFLILSNGDIYKGFTNDIVRRLQEHEEGKVDSTKNYRPVKLMGYETYCLKSDAMRREKFLKTTEGRRLLNQQYRDVIEEMQREVRQVIRPDAQSDDWANPSGVTKKN